MISMILFYKKKQDSEIINICFYKHIIIHEITWSSKIFLSSMVATNLRKLFKLVKIKKNNNKFLSYISHVWLVAAIRDSRGQQR